MTIRAVRFFSTYPHNASVLWIFFLCYPHYAVDILWIKWLITYRKRFSTTMEKLSSSMSTELSIGKTFVV